MINDGRYNDQETGLVTLQRLSEANQFNEWIFTTISPYLKGSVLEIGSGIGNLSHFFLSHHIKLTLSELNQSYCDILKKRFSGHPSLVEIRSLDIEMDDKSGGVAELKGKFDTVVALNVIEHIQDHDRALQNCRTLLSARGFFVILVPAYPVLYNNLDKGLGHHRRYTGRSLQKLLERNGFEVVKKMHFNAAGLLGWSVAGLMHKKIIPGGQLKIYDKLVPLWKLIDSIFFHSIGLSVIQVACRKD